MSKGITTGGVYYTPLKKKRGRVRRVVKGVKAGTKAFVTGMKPPPLTKAQVKARGVSRRKTKRQVRKIWHKLI